MNWSVYNNSLVRRGEILLDFSLLELFIEESSRLIKTETIAGRLADFISKRLGVEFKAIANFEKIKIIPKLKKLNSADLSLIIRELNDIAKEKGQTLTLFLDEIQEMFRVAGLNLGSLFHDIYDWCRNTVVLMAGSAPSLIINFLNSIEYEKPFFGRLC